MSTISGDGEICYSSQERYDMRLVAVQRITTDMAVGVDVVEAEPRCMLRTGREHRYSIFFWQF